MQCELGSIVRARESSTECVVGNSGNSITGSRPKATGNLCNAPRPRTQRRFRFPWPSKDNPAEASLTTDGTFWFVGHVAYKLIEHHSPPPVFRFPSQGICTVTPNRLHECLTLLTAPRLFYSKTFESSRMSSRWTLFLSCGIIRVRGHDSTRASRRGCH